MPPVIGVDFDNTLASYDDLLFRLARERGLIPPEAAKTKKAIRDRVRLLPDGEIEWQRLQGAAYGPRMGEARLIEGVEEFFRRCRESGVALRIVSHKTEFAGYDETRTNLRDAATRWMAQQRFFDADGFGLAPGDVFFESTRQGKIERIIRLGCAHFVDDLEETFLEPAFPAGVGKILFAADGRQPELPDVRVFTNWRDISRFFFDANA